LQNQKGAQISARVVTQSVTRQGVASYGIEFVEHDESAKTFWGISFPSNA
jgi:hypothetical protein